MVSTLHVILTMKFCKIWELQGVKILADQLTLSQPEGADYSPLPLRFSDIAPFLIIIPKIIIIPNILKYKGLLIQGTSILITAPKAKYIGVCLNQICVISETVMNVCRWNKCRGSKFQTHLVWYIYFMILTQIACLFVQNTITDMFKTC